jgi:glycosyltransferase AcbS
LHIIECHFEFSGFDDHLVKAGTSVYLWNLVRQFRAAGHRVTAVTPAHGLLPYLRKKYEIARLDWQLSDEVPIRLDPFVWKGYPEEVTLPVSAFAYQMRVEEIDIVMLSGELLDKYSDSFYPPGVLEGKDLSFLKPLAFQVAAARFLADNIEPGAIVHLHEPMYHYLLPAALSGRSLSVVSTVQTNMPVNRKVYGPEVRSVLSHLGADATSADGLADPPLDSTLHRAMRSYLPQTHLYQDYPDRPGHDYISMLALVVRTVAAMDFLSEGQLEHALTQAETPFEQLFHHLAVRRELNLHADRLVVGGCAIGDEWLDVRRTSERRERTLSELGLDTAQPTIYHNSRYSVQHKGQKELFRALRRLLDEGERCNVLLHCLAPQPPNDPDLDALVHDHPSFVRINTGPMTSAELMDWAASSDLSVFPSKFEMDTFLMAMGEAMASGSIPIATAQRGMQHFGHSFSLDDPESTGLALPRSFRVDDPLLTQAVYEGLHRMLRLLRTDPARVATLRERSVEVGRRFTWAEAARRFLAVFQACASGARPADATPAIRHWRPNAALDSPSIRDPGHGSAERTADAIGVKWSKADAASVDIIHPGNPAQVFALEKHSDGTFMAMLPQLTAKSLAVLVIGRDGKSTWTELEVR